LNSYRFEAGGLAIRSPESRDDKKIEIERFNVTSSKPFNQVVAAFDAAIGHLG
jgi:hypothetical protein